MADIKYPRQFVDYRPIGRPRRPLDYWTDTTVRQKQVIYWPNLVTWRTRI